MAIKANRNNTFTGHSGAIYALENSLEENKFFSGSGDHVIAEWDVANPASGKMLANIPEIIYTLKLIPEEKILLIGQAAGGIHVLDLASGEELRLLQYHKAAVFDIGFSKKNNLLFSAGGDGTFSISRLNDFSLIKTIKLADEKIRSIAVHPDETELAVGCGEGSICIFDLPSLEIKKRWMAHTQNFSVNAVVYFPDGNYLLSGSRDAHLNIFDVKNNNSLLNSLPAHNYAIYSIVFSPDSTYFATASRDKTIKVWNAEKMEFLIRLDKENYNGHNHSVNKLLWKKNCLLSASDDRVVIGWQIG